MQRVAIGLVALMGFARVAAAAPPDVMTIVKGMKAALEPPRPVVRQFTLKISAMDGESTSWTGAQARKVVGGQQQMLTVLLGPDSVNGTAWLLREGGPQQAATQWMYLPAIRRVNEIAPVDAYDAFLGSDFTFADLGFEPLHARYRLIDTELRGDRKVYQIEAKPPQTVQNWQYSRIVSWIDVENLMPTDREFYDLAGKLYKVEFFERPETIDGTPTILRMRMENRHNRDKSELTFTKVAYDGTIPDDLFELPSMSKAAAAPLWSAP